MDKIYKIVLLGPTGVGKSQLCNFIMKDKENKTFKVSQSINSCTQDPQLEYYTRNIEESEIKEIKLELIDTAGSSDSGDNDERNFKSLIEKLREKKNVDFFFLVLNCTTRLEGPHKQYIKMISETFTPNEFYGHLEIIYTHYPNNEKEQKKCDTKKVEIIDAIKNIIGKATLNLDPPPGAWSLDTDTDDNDNFIEKYQKTIDTILLRMIAKVNKYGVVNTENLQYKGVKDRIKEEKEKIEKAKKEIEKKQKEIEEETKRNEEEKKRNEERKKRIELEKEIERKRRNEFERLMLLERKRIQRQIEIQKIIEESERKRELELREQQEYLRRIEYENERKKQELEEKQRRLYILQHERRGFCFVF
jgi:flagellar biosynthesis GTPase FlhF